MKKEIIILIGAPCSGKSTWAKQYIKENPRTLRFSRDDMRMMMKNQPMLDASEEHVITQIVYAGITSGISIDRNIIIDQTNVRLTYINGFIKTFCELHDVKFRLVVLIRDLDLLLRRNIERSTITKIPRIPEEVITRMHKSLEEMLDSREFQKIREQYECHMV